MFLFVLFVISVIGNVVLGAALYRSAQRRLRHGRRKEPLIARHAEPKPEPEIELARPKKPLQAFATVVAPGIEAGYWEPAMEIMGEHEPFLALHFRNGGSYPVGNAVLRIPADHYLSIDGMFPLDVTPGPQFRSDYHPAKVAFSPGVKLSTPTHSSPRLDGSKIELPAEEIDKIVAEHEFLARYFAAHAEESQAEGEKP